MFLEPECKAVNRGFTRNARSPISRAYLFATAVALPPWKRLHDLAVLTISKLPPFNFCEIFFFFFVRAAAKKMGVPTSYEKAAER